ncbi:MAG: fused MFS/spermidine synthase [Bacteroidia bacterium]|nr:fused MFS/spermidine synthase [Bacteroidia bacterium]
MLRKILSFFIPITKNIKSDHSGNLEVTVINGKKLLNTTNTNYSYGSLERIMKFSLKKLELSKTNSTLLLGLGGGCVLKTLREDFHYNGEITAVDIDPVIIGIAEKEFNIVADKSTKIICSDAYSYVKENKSKFDLIIIDLFIDDKVPDQFTTQEFWRHLLEHLNQSGKVIFNTLCNPYTNLQAIEEKFLRRGIDYKIYRYVDQTNKVLIVNYPATANI